MRNEDDLDAFDKECDHAVLLGMAELLKAWRIHDTGRVSQIRQNLLNQYGWDITPSQSTVSRPKRGDSPTGPPEGW